MLNNGHNIASNNDNDNNNNTDSDKNNVHDLPLTMIKTKIVIISILIITKKVMLIMLRKRVNDIDKRNYLENIYR